MPAIKGMGNASAQMIGTVTFNDDQWLALEETIEHKLDSKTCKRICDCVVSYFLEKKLQKDSVDRYKLISYKSSDFYKFQKHLNTLVQYYKLTRKEPSFRGLLDDFSNDVCKKWDIDIFETFDCIEVLSLHFNKYFNAKALLPYHPVTSKV